MAGPRGISPSYFAGMPTVARDPRAGQMDASYAAMPGQALSETNALNQRRHEFDSGEAFKAKELALQTEQQQGAASRDDRRLGMYQQGEDRRQEQQSFENDRLKAADTRKLVEALQSAVDQGEDGIAEALAAELKSRGWGVQPIADGAQASPPGGPPPPTAPPRAPMSPADAATSKQLDQAEATIIPKLRGNMPAKQAGDADLAAQLGAADKKYSNGLSGGSPTPMPYEQAMLAANRAGALGVKQVPGGWAPITPGDDSEPPYMAGKPKSLLPGRGMRPQVAQSNAFISEGDPYARIK